MTTDYQVTAAEPPAVAAEVCRVWDENLALTTPAAVRFEWVFTAPPDPPPAVYVLTATEPGTAPRVVGTAGVAERRFVLLGRSRSAAQLVDLAVDRAHRSLGPALRLVRETRDGALAAHEFAYGLPNASARGVFRRAGYREVSSVTRWARVLRHARYIESWLGARRLARTLGPAIDWVVRFWSSPRLPFEHLRYELVCGATIDARFDDLWQRSHHEYSLVAWRGAALLRWRFGRPGHEVFGLQTRGRSPELRAYAVVELSGATAHLRDLFGHRKDLGPLLDLLLPVLRTRGATSVSFMCMAPKPLRAMLRRRRFSARERERILFFDATNTQILSRLSDAELWYVTDADDDA